MKTPEELLEFAKNDYLVGRMLDKDRQNGEDLLHISSTREILGFMRWVQVNSED